MASLQLELPEELKAQVERRTAEEGYASIGQYLESLIRADAGVDYAGPEHLRVLDDEDLKRKLQQGAKSPAREFSAADWEQKRRQLAERQTVTCVASVPRTSHQGSGTKVR